MLIITAGNVVASALRYLCLHQMVVSAMFGKFKNQSSGERESNPLFKYCRSNCPGPWHDAEVAVPLYLTNLTRYCPSPFKLVADSAFPCASQFKDKVISVPKETSRQKARETDEEIYKYGIITKHRQPAEWGMSALQGGFGRLHTKLTANKRDRSKMLTVIWHLHNYRTRTVGINQTRDVYYNLWKQYCDVDG